MASKIIKIDSSYLTLTISKGNIRVKFFNHSTQLDKADSLDKFFSDNIKDIDKSKIQIKRQNNGSFERFKEVLEVFKKNGITTFSVVSY